MLLVQIVAKEEKVNCKYRDEEEGDNTYIYIHIHLVYSMYIITQFKKHYITPTGKSTNHPYFTHTTMQLLKNSFNY
jgi:hypothetical protein